LLTKNIYLFIYLFTYFIYLLIYLFTYFVILFYLFIDVFTFCSVLLQSHYCDVDLYNFLK